MMREFERRKESVCEASAQGRNDKKREKAGSLPFSANSAIIAADEWS
jgi:hypothetical protein